MFKLLAVITVIVYTKEKRGFMKKSYYNPEWQQKYYQTHKEELRAKSALRRQNHEIRRKAHLSVLRHRANQKGLEYTIVQSDILWPTHCPLLGLTLNYFANKNGADSPSIDRIDSQKGYTKENVWVISKRANTIKSDATLEELEAITKNLRKKLELKRES